MSPAQARPFIVIGENIHCTRKIKRGGKLVKPMADGSEGVRFEDEFGNEGVLPVPEGMQAAEAYKSGWIRHVAAAVELGMAGNDEEKALGVAYISWLAHRQAKRGSHYLDVNVDEISPNIDARNAAMEWIVGVLAKATHLPLSIDSSEVATLEVGLKAVEKAGGAKPLLNSASLERPEALELAAKYQCPTIIMGASESGLPTGVDDRIENLTAMVEKAMAAGLPLENLFADPLIYTISSTPTVGMDVLETVRQLRAKFPAIRIAGGHSNISFGLPGRRLLNAVWLSMAMDAGVDSGLIDPLTCHPDDVARLDPDSDAVKLARDGFLGKDEYFGEYIMAHREGKLTLPF